MERIRALINKLKEQSDQHANISAMMVTVQMIQSELTQLSSSATQEWGSSKVAVLLPSSNKTSFTHKGTMAVPVTKPIVEPPLKTVAEPPEKNIEEPVSKNHNTESNEKIIAEPESRNVTDPIVVHNKEILQPAEARTNGEHVNKVTAKAEMVGEGKRQDQSGWLFDPVQEIPTLAHQKEFKEMNDVFGEIGTSSSLNDKLKTERKELASVLNEGPVRDLKKAIGINDRFVFLSELFRGDEAMYERSIKTINNFRIYPEAEYWIERELKVKLGWDEKKDVVKQFRQLVKRRFL